MLYQPPLFLTLGNINIFGGFCCKKIKNIEAPLVEDLKENIKINFLGKKS